MKILLSNDDGCQAKGLLCLKDELAHLGDVTVVAPDRNRSGASNSLTLDSPLRVHQHGERVYCVDGTPTDCVHLAITGLLDEEPDIVVSGINAGPNLGDDVLYSGTVAAAMEGRFLGLPAIAVSLASSHPEHYSTAAVVVRRLVTMLARGNLAPDTILNVNVPDRLEAALAGVIATRLGHRHRAEPVVRAKDPRGRPIYWVGAVGTAEDGGPGTDFAAVRDGFVSVTPLKVDFTRHETLPELGDWLEGLADRDGPAVVKGQVSA
ncbi:MAG TPA: 5'/3'-nucleotidase SurE [Gammaproteobacteria bacterium]|nr:5'/3'-nucleotidase SurE [Gammaproteobacteria bacterium]